MLYTYAATRPLRAIYFDGLSAKQSRGTLEMQDMLISLDSRAEFEGNPNAERGRLLCKWGKEYGIQGFVREGPHLRSVFYPLVGLDVLYNTR